MTSTVTKCPLYRPYALHKTEIVYEDLAKISEAGNTVITPGVELETIKFRQNLPLGTKNAFWRFSFEYKFEKIPAALV